MFLDLKSEIAILDFFSNFHFQKKFQKNLIFKGFFLQKLNNSNRILK